MKQLAMIFGMIASAAVLVFFSPAQNGWAETTTVPVESQITVKIDKDRYDRGDVMTISGAVKNAVSRIPLTIQIVDPTNNLVHVEQILVAADGRFSLSIKIDGPMWRLPGEYSLIVQYGFKHVSATVPFKFEEEGIPVAGVFNVKDLSSGQNFDLNYTIVGGTMSSIAIDPQDISLVAQIDTQIPGMVHLQIPRLLLDAKKPGNSDESFLVFVNDDEITSFTEKTDPQYRTLDIPIIPGDYKIEIVGTTIVPEFDGISAMILALAVGMAVFAIPKMKLRYAIT